MKLKKAINLGDSCGLRTIRECIVNVEIHSMNLFKYDEIENEINEIHLDIEELTNQYELCNEDILNWTISEAKLYV